MLPKPTAPKIKTSPLTSHAACDEVEVADSLATALGRPTPLPLFLQVGDEDAIPVAVDDAQDALCH